MRLDSQGSPVAGIPPIPLSTTAQPPKRRQRSPERPELSLTHKGERYATEHEQQATASQVEAAVDLLLAIAADAEATAAALIEALDDASGDADAEPNLAATERHPSPYGYWGNDRTGDQTKWSSGGTDDLEEQCEGGGGDEDCEDDGADTGDKEPSLGWSVDGAMGGTSDGEGPDDDAEPSMGWMNPMGEVPAGYGLSDGDADDAFDVGPRPGHNGKAEARELLATIPASRRRYRGGNVQSLSDVVMLANGQPYIIRPVR